MKDIEVQHNKTYDRWYGEDKGKVIDVMWNEFHEQIDRNIDESLGKKKFIEQCNSSLRARDFVEKLKEIELDDFQITASTENGRIYFLVTDIEYRDSTLPGLDKVLMLTGNF